MVHLLQDLVEPHEFKLALGWFKRVPGKVAHADPTESCLFHERNILLDLFARAIYRLVAGADKQLTFPGPSRMLLRTLSKKQRSSEEQRRRTQDFPQVHLLWCGWQ